MDKITNEDKIIESNELKKMGKFYLVSAQAPVYLK